MMLCPVCKKNPAIVDPYWGLLPCKDCMDRQAGLARPGGQVEFVGESIKEQRQKFHKDIVPDHRKNELNKEFVDIYGEKRARELGYSDKEIKHAKYVYQEEGYYKK